jgi:hypothetical protein
MPFDPTKPANGDVVDADAMRNQLNDLNARLVAAMAALDWSNGCPKLPDYTTIANPQPGNIAFDYATESVRMFRQGAWEILATV